MFRAGGRWQVCCLLCCYPAQPSCRMWAVEFAHESAAAMSRCEGPCCSAAGRQRRAPRCGRLGRICTLFSLFSCWYFQTASERRGAMVPPPPPHYSVMRVQLPVLQTQGPGSPGWCCFSPLSLIEPLRHSYAVTNTRVGRLSANVMYKLETVHMAADVTWEITKARC